MPRSRRLFRTAALALCFASACTDDVVGSGDDESSESSSNDESGDTDEVPAELGGPAQGVTITSVEVNQGTGVEIIRDGQLVPLEQRNAKLIRSRDTLVRVHHRIDDAAAWIPRELTGILHIAPPDGPELVRTRTFVVEADSDPRKLGSSFYFSLLADEALPGTTIWIELRETDANLDVSSLSPGLSTTEVAAFEFEDTALELHVVLIPVRYEYLDPPREPDITQEDLALFHDFLLQQNPVQNVRLEVRAEPIVRTEQLSNLGSLLAPTREAKLQDGAGPNVYYHALVDVGGPSVNQVGGIAMLTDASKEESGDRVAATVYHKHVDIPDEDEEDQTPKVFPPTGSARTFVHEVGHNQGFSHIACPNADAAGPDPSYPHADGKIGAYGFGIRDFHIYTPSASHDYMTYCGNSWVSDWTWDKAFTRIQILTSWNGEQAGPAPTPTPVLVGLRSADGHEEWSISLGIAPTAASSDARIEYAIDGALAASVPAQIDLLSDDATVLITAPLPIPLAEVDGVTWLHAGQRRVIDRARIQATSR